MGELLARRWRSFDLEIGTMSVREPVFDGKFREHRLRATRPASDDLVFGHRNGEPRRESKLRRNILQPAAEAASHRQAIEALERELFPRVIKLPDGAKPAKSATGDFRGGLELEAPPGFEPGVEVLQISP
jgi:hypothetical protein